MNWIDEFQNEFPGTHLRDEPMSRHTNFRIGGPADLMYIPNSVNALDAALRYLNQNGIPVLILGGGYNLLVSDQGFRGAAVKLPEGITDPIHFQEQTVTASAGLPLKRLVREAAARGLAGIENLAGIPGTVGGAIYMNAGAYGSCVADVFRSAQAVCPEGGLRSMSVADLQFNYRSSILQEMRCTVITGAVFKLRPGANPAELEDRCREIIRIRNGKHPVGLPSAGSFFRNTRGLPPAGRLIEEAGLKGLAVGGAQVSPMHANFIVNTGGATCREVLDLMARVQEHVQRIHGVLLEPEVRIIP